MSILTPTTPGERPLPAVVERRRRRLGEELADESVPVPLDGELGATLLAELDHARHPEVHEGTASPYGALVLPPDRDLWTGADTQPVVLGLEHIELADAQRFADGRSTFVVHVVGGGSALVALRRPVVHESALVELGRGTGAYVVQRTDTGRVRVVCPDGIVTWDSVRWTFKPLAEQYAAPLRRLLPNVSRRALDGLLELAVHRLSPAGVGATIVWTLDDDAPEHRPGIDLGAAVPSPALRVDDDAHHAALVSAASQLDRAVLVGADGLVTRFGVGLLNSARAEARVPPLGGTRHTSARRYSYDDPAAVVIVVSEDGPVTVLRGGAPAAEVRIDPCATSIRVSPPPIGSAAGSIAEVRCPRCEVLLLVDIVHFDGWDGPPERLTCPVCEHEVVVDEYRAAVGGVIAGPPPS
ncbi:MAG TPA: diadenylate cyclase [Acidimicrobiales bacterium]|nr:diadenylate cyclase [Acidimicrobiales bacterium]